jgi:hypothetical protein
MGELYQCPITTSTASQEDVKDAAISSWLLCSGVQTTQEQKVMQNINPWK